MYDALYICMLKRGLTIPETTLRSSNLLHPKYMHRWRVHTSDVGLGSRGASAHAAFRQRHLQSLPPLHIPSFDTRLCQETHMATSIACRHPVQAIACHATSTAMQVTLSKTTNQLDRSLLSRVTASPVHLAREELFPPSKSRDHPCRTSG